jgi:hypothetical protein
MAGKTLGFGGRIALTAQKAADPVRHDVVSSA